jgi:putative transposase
MGSWRAGCGGSRTSGSEGRAGETISRDAGTAPRSDPYYLHVRSDHQVTSKAVVIATGVTEEGRREILGIEIGDSEDEAFWREFLRSLKRRGLSGVRLVISDQHAGLVAAIKRCFQGAAHQRCRVHFARNLLANIPKGHQEMVAAAFRTIFAQVSPEEISAQWDHVEAMLTERFDKAAALMRRAKEEVLAFRTFPRAHWRQIWSTNPLERLNKEIKRRSRVVGIFPNEEAAVRLCGAVVLDINDEWASAERRYFSEGSMAGLYPPRDDEDATPAELAFSE